MAAVHIKEFNSLFAVKALIALADFFSVSQRAGLSSATGGGRSRFTIATQIMVAFNPNFENVNAFGFHCPFL